MNAARRAGTALTLTALLGACTGGGPLQLAEGGISGTGVSLGTISEFGSVVVNGSRLEVTARTEIAIDGVPVTQSELAIGQVIRAQVDFDTLHAERIDYAETVRGVIESVVIDNPDTLSATLNVLGQTVRTNTATNFLDTAGADTLRPGDAVDVSGARNAAGDILATFVELKSGPLGEFRVSGPVSSLGSDRFSIGGLSVGFGSADTSGLPEPLVEGRIVRVRGAAAGFVSSPPALEAGRIEPGLVLGAASDDSVEIEGIVTRVRSAVDFQLGAQAVDARTAVFVGGSAADISLNARLEVEGSVDAAGVLLAQSVTIKPRQFLLIDAPIEQVDPGAGSLRLLGITVRVGAGTRMRDESGAGLAVLTLADLSPGERIEVRGQAVGGVVTATRLAREDPRDRVLLMGPVEARDAAGGTLTLLGIEVGSDPATAFEDASESPVSAQEFFQAIATGTLVKARWDPFVSLAMPADELSIEEEN